MPRQSEISGKHKTNFLFHLSHEIAMVRLSPINEKKKKKKGHITRNCKEFQLSLTLKQHNTFALDWLRFWLSFNCVIFTEAQCHTMVSICTVQWTLSLYEVWMKSVHKNPNATNIKGIFRKIISIWFSSLNVNHAKQSWQTLKAPIAETTN